MISTPLLKFENVNKNKLLAFIDQTGCRINELDAKPTIDNGMQFRRFTISKQAAQAGGCIIIQPNNPDNTFISLSLDLRRIWKVWKIPSDQKLLLVISNVLVENGGVIIHESGFVD